MGAHVPAAWGPGPAVDGDRDAGCVRGVVVQRPPPQGDQHFSITKYHFRRLDGENGRAGRQGTQEFLENWWAFVKSEKTNPSFPPQTTPQFPQMVAIGVSEFFYIGLIEFFYQQAPVRMRSVTAALALLSFGIASFAASGVIAAVGSHTDWLPGKGPYNQGRLER